MPPKTVPITTPQGIRAKHIGYVLPNGVKCIIIQDPNTKVPAAAMSIRAGQLNDPTYLPGLAHFCEHMLFMGTQKYPREDEYNSYISTNNGHSNAYTTDAATVFYFAVSASALPGALERFVEFFVSPNFNDDAVNREVQAVHSEDEKNHSVDYWRTDEIYRSLYDDSHPRSRYGNGNNITLVEEPKKNNVNLLGELKSFYAQYYLSAGACIAVCSDRSPEEILAIIEGPLQRMKEGVPASFSFRTVSGTPFKQESMGMWLNIRTLKKSRKISFKWPVHSAASLWRSNPGAYISHIIGHECATSVLGFLKREGLATALMAGPQQIDDDFQLFSVEVELTLNGFRQLNRVVTVLHQGIGLAVAGGIDSAAYADMKKENCLGFASAEVGTAYNHCVMLSSAALETSLADCWVAGSVVLEDNIEAVLAYAQQLVPKRMIVSLQWGNLPISSVIPTNDPTEKEAEGTEEEEEDSGEESEELFSYLLSFARKKADTCTQFHRTQFSHVRIPEEQLNEWHQAMSGPYLEGLALPPRNPFLATDFTLYDPTTKVAVREQFSTPHGTTTIRKDVGHHNTFRCSLRWNVLSPVAYASPLNRVYLQVMHAVLSDAIGELTYFGELASLENQLSPDAGGVGISVTGPYQKVPEFFFAVLERSLDSGTLNCTEETYNNYLDAYVRRLQSLKSIQPYEHALQRLASISNRLSYEFEVILEASPGASYSGYRSFVREYLESGFLFECFVAGNIPSAQCIMDEVVWGIEQRLSDSKVPVPMKSGIPRFRDSLILPRGSSTPAGAVTALDIVSLPPFSPSDCNVCAMLSIYVGEECPRVRMLSSITARLLASKFFNALRTRETLGYVVQASAQQLHMSAYISFLVQSALEDVDGVYLLSRIIAFLSAVADSSDRLCCEEDLTRIKEGLIAQLEKKPSSVMKDALTLQGDYLHPSGVDHTDQELQYVQAVTVDAVEEFLRCCVLNGRTHTKGLGIIINSARTMSSDALSTPGDHLVDLPARRGSTTEVSADASGESLVLPSYGDGSAKVAVHCWPSVAAFREGKEFSISHTF